MPAFSKLGIINSCLLLKGQHTCNTEDDGSKEWLVCSAAYDQGAAHLLQEHDWKFATEIAEATRLGDSADNKFDDEYQKPEGALHVVWVKLLSEDADVGADYSATDYRLVGNKIQITDDDSDVFVKYIAEPDPDEWPPMFVSALMEWVYSGIENGLKHDATEARKHLGAADAFLQRARTRTDQQEPKRALFKTRHRTARQYRRG